MIAWLLVPFILIALVLLARRRRRRLRRELIRERSPEHQAALDMLQDWLANEKIARALVRGGVFSMDRLEQIDEEAGNLSEAELWAVIAVATRERTVRRVIADHLMRRFPGTTREEALKGLLSMHEHGSGKKISLETEELNA